MLHNQTFIFLDRLQWYEVAIRNRIQTFTIAVQRFSCLLLLLLILFRPVGDGCVNVVRRLRFGAVCCVLRLIDQSTRGGRIG